MLTGSAGQPIYPVPTPQAETSSWVAQVVTNGGTVSAIQQARVDLVIAALKAASLWTLIDDIWWLAAQSSIQALTSLKGLRLAVATASPVFLQTRGYTFNGTSSYIDTTFNPSTMGVAMTGSSLRIGVYNVANVNSNNISAGVRVASSSSLYGISTRVSNTTAQINLLNNSVTFSVTLPANDSRGYSVGNRSAGPVFTMYKNGTSAGTYTPGGNITVLPAAKLYIGCQNNNGTAAFFRGDSTSWVDVGGSLTSGQEATMYGIVNNAMKYMGCATQ